MKAVLALDPATLPRAQQATLSLPVPVSRGWYRWPRASSSACCPPTAELRARPWRRVVARPAARPSAAKRRLRRALVAAQRSIAVVLLVGVGPPDEELLAPARACPPYSSRAGCSPSARRRRPRGIARARDVTAFYGAAAAEVRQVPGVTVAGCQQAACLAIPFTPETGPRDRGPHLRSGHRAGGRTGSDHAGVFEASRRRLVGGRLPAAEDDAQGARCSSTRRRPARSSPARSGGTASPALAHDRVSSSPGGRSRAW